MFIFGKTQDAPKFALNEKSYLAVSLLFENNVVGYLWGFYVLHVF